jgi:glycosyltransferase involved in cell wall biosynthesis
MAADQFRGGTQAIPFDGGRLAVVHEVSARDKKRHYQHRFVWFDAAHRLRRVSRPFYFVRSGIEFAAGLAWHPDGNRLLISYCVNDAESWIATVESNDVRRLLEEIESQPQLGGEAVRETSFLPASLEVFVRPLAIAKPEETALQPVSNNAKSAWVPRVPLAGTEIMVAALRERLGKELDQINLQVNHPGDARSDHRPSVVWMHHDINQQWVQWCNDKALVETVTRFVFVSHWQRERYLNAFGLPPQRCLVLRHALDRNPEMRRWEPAPIFRCAYASTPFRGLSVLLSAWERLRPANAELHIWSSMKLYLGDDGPYEHLYARARSLPGVIYHGLAPNPELRAALRSMHFFIYPSTFAETACLAAIEAMAAGCRLIAPSLGALPETTGGYARIYAANPDEDAHVTIFSENLASELANPWAGSPELSFLQQHHCTATYDWPRRLHEWRELIRSVGNHADRRAALELTAQ